MAGVTLSQSPAQPLALTDLSDEQAAEVRSLAARAASVDGVGPLSEQAGHALTARGDGDVQHFLAYAGDGLAGYAQVVGGAEAAVEMVVDPSHRRQGVGSDLWAAIAGEHPEARVWAHGNLPAGRGFAAALGLEPVRELHKMSRPLHPQDADPASNTLPAGFSARAFVPGQDEQAWLEANAAAFADHPEQGRMSLADLRDRMAQDWFDPSGFIIVEANDAPGAVAAFHWTKVDPEQRSTLDPAATAGEVYVVGVHPAYQGRGLARPLTALGLAHLAGLGLPEVVLYVDGDNPAALQTYSRLGFRSMMVDVMYSRALHDPLSG